MLDESNEFVDFYADDVVDDIEYISVDITRQYLNDIKSKRLSPEEESRLLSRIANNELLAKNTLLTHNLHLVVNIAKTYQHRGLPLIDLIAEGNLGLLSALDHFKIEKECRFSTYATWWVHQFIRKAVSRSRMVYLPIVLIRQINVALKEMKAHDNKCAKVAAKLNISISKLHDLLILSEHPVYFDHDDEHASLSLVDNGDTERSFIEREQKKKINAEMSLLTKRQAFVIRKRFGFDGEDPMSLDETASLMGLSRESVRIIQNDALKILKKKIVYA